MASCHLSCNEPQLNRHMTECRIRNHRLHRLPDFTDLVALLDAVRYEYFHALVNAYAAEVFGKWLYLANRFCGEGVAQARPALVRFDREGEPVPAGRPKRPGSRRQGAVAPSCKHKYRVACPERSRRDAKHHGAG